MLDVVECCLIWFIVLPGSAIMASRADTFKFSFSIIYCYGSFSMDMDMCDNVGKGVVEMFGFFLCQMHRKYYYTMVIIAIDLYINYSSELVLSGRLKDSDKIGHDIL